MILIAHDDDQSAVVSAYAIAVANVLSQPERVVAGDVVDHDDGGLDAQLVVELEHGFVDAADGARREHAIRIGNVLRAVGEVGQRDVIGTPVGGFAL